MSSCRCTITPFTPISVRTGNSSCGIAFMSVRVPRELTIRFPSSTLHSTFSPEMELRVCERIDAGTATTPPSTTSPRTPISIPASKFVARITTPLPLTSITTQERTGSDSFFPVMRSASCTAESIFSFTVTNFIRNTLYIKSIITTSGVDSVEKVIILLKVWIFCWIRIVENRIV